MKKVPYLLLLIFYGCDPCMDTPPCVDYFTFRIISKTNQKDLVFDPNPTYNRDSVSLMTAGYPNSWSTNDGVRFHSNYHDPVDTFFLRLNSLDTDTLVMSYQYVKHRCCGFTGYGKITGIKYNGVDARTEGSTFIFEK